MALKAWHTRWWVVCFVSADSSFQRMVNEEEGTCTHLMFDYLQITRSRTQVVMAAQKGQSKTHLFNVYKPLGLGDVKKLLADHASQAVSLMANLLAVPGHTWPVGGPPRHHSLVLHFTLKRRHPHS